MVEQFRELEELSVKLKKQADLHCLNADYLNVYFENSSFEDYLTQHLAPYFLNSVEDNPPQFNVYCFMLNDIEKFAGLFAQEQKIKHYSLSENKVYQKLAVPISDCENFVYDPQNHSIIQTKNNEMTIFSNSSHYNQACKRVIRDELIYGLTQVNDNPAILLHSACAMSQDGKGILICGDKGAGKTTTLVNLLAAGYDLVSNDLTFAKMIDGEVFVKGTPESINIGFGTAAKFSQLRDIIPPKMVNLSDHELWQTHLKPELDWQALAERFQVNLVSGWVRLGVILFPKIGENLLTKTNQLSQLQLKRELENNYRGIIAGNNVPWSSIIQKRLACVNQTRVNLLRNRLLDTEAISVRYSGGKDVLLSAIQNRIG
mgnify:CR=1 FL=1